nr:MAG TPA: hypothetical protein [Caudoviricetes sp.]
MNLLNKYATDVSVEGVNPFEHAALETIALAIEEMEEVLEVAEQAQDEIEDANQEAERLERARDSEELNNQVIEGIVAEREDGKLTEQEQALAQVNRAAVVSSLGIDPESEEGQEYIEEVTDEPISNEAMNDKDSFIGKLIDGAKKALQFIVKKVKEFFESAIGFLAKINNGAKAKFTKLIKALENADPNAEEEFKKNQLKAFEEAKESNFRRRIALMLCSKDGKLAGLNVAQKEVAQYLKDVTAPIDQYANIVSGITYPTKEKVEELKAVRDRIDEIDLKAGMGFLGKKLDKAVNYQEARKVAEDSLQHLDSFTKLIDRLLKDYKAKIDKATDGSDKLYKHLENVEGDDAKEASFIVKASSATLRTASMKFTTISGALLQAGGVVADVLYKSVRQVEPAK